MNFYRVLILLIVPFFVFSQTKKPISHKDYNSWKNLEYSRISFDGKYISYQINPEKGDGVLFVENPDKSLKYFFDRGYSQKFSANSNFIAFKVKPQADSLHLQKFKKIKKDKQYKDSLFVMYFIDNTTAKFPNIKSYGIPSKKSEFVVFLHNKEIKNKSQKDTLKSDTIATDTTKINKQYKVKSDGTKLCVYYPKTKDTVTYKYVNEYDYDKYSNYISYISITKDSLDTSRVYLFDAKNKTQKIIFEKQGNAKKITFDYRGNNLAFIFSADTAKPYKYSLYYYNIKSGEIKIIADTIHGNLPNNYDVSPDANMYFSENTSKLYFGIRPVPVKEKKDSLLDDERCRVDVWSWTDNYLMPRQLKQLKKEKKRSYISVYNLKSDKIIQLADTVIKNVRVFNKGNNKYAIGIVSDEYAKSLSWDIQGVKDYYLINTETGNKKLILGKSKSALYISPAEKYLYWYSMNDSSWYAKTLIGKPVNLTENISTKFYNEDNDVPALPEKYGYTGWVKEDKFILIYDKYDIWEIDPTGKIKAQNITKGRKDNLIFRYKKFDRDNIFVEDNMLLSVFNKKNKQSGYYSYNTNNKKLTKLTMENVKFYDIKKSKENDKYIWRKMAFDKYPDLEYGNLDFNNSKKISNLDKQRDKFLWGSVELTSWVSFNGDTLEGLIYKPENFDKNKKYPMLVYFYEKYSDDIHRFYTPKPIRSVINFPYYVSNGYVIFIPNIKYGTGTPGNDAYNAVVSGTMKLMENKWVDNTKVGIQGQSWGGYQVAYLVTRTNIYSAAMAGAPVSNMTSAYGGIRWGTGMSRMFQYEKTQSRIGGSLWDKRELYIENSPVFFADRVKTPLLIMHNDGDGAVPWYQGIEYFVALRRLNKAVWMLNYNGDEHNLSRRPNMIDLTIRMNQFFDTYLKDKPAPNWMKYGVKAIDKDKVNGMKLIK